ncbi:TetR/AcrR family transcriptional regulator [Allonocardiopsis opalescens]|uniref:TetR family transcriptional regulator n=1 Tax=Allonocardiopsis opalescens TaxID=1144618 RepID=A0A2T0Q9J1_9ACTN|nr:TetR/AcrR family transcriptional regulator [Allonocardiopsis opalescens]PRY00507.1 TetR family transcriptional regulator [Allonocardiopsis opalescens]
MNPTRTRLIDAATRLLDAGGPAAVTLREVGRRAGVSHNAPYKHFAGKQDLLAAIAADQLRTLTDRMRAAAADHPAGVDAVKAAITAYLDWAQRHPARFTLTFGPWEGESDELGQAAAAARQVLHDLVAAACDNGTFPGEPAPTAALIWTLAHGAVDLSQTGHMSKSGADPTPDALVGLLIQTLRRPASPPPPAADGTTVM